ncbi:MAG TPA: hypothetical protein VJV79_33455 [Polyangiaceae bacterium]|nr:hypothetical protein [Polyangiaceae bacterium]
MDRVLSWLLGGMGLCLLWALVSRIRRYGGLFSDAHFLSIASRAPELKRAALARIIDAETEAIYDAGDPRVLKTEVGLAIVYTVSRREAEFIHHCSVSFPGQHIAQGSGELFLHFVVRLLGLPTQQMRFYSGMGAAQHAECALSPEDHAALATQAPPERSRADLLALRSEAMRARVVRRAYA